MICKTMGLYSGFYTMSNANKETELCLGEVERCATNTSFLH